MLLSTLIGWFQNEQHILLAAILFGIVQLTLWAQFGNMQQGYVWAAGARDEPRPPLKGYAGRMERAFKNFMETFPYFAALVLLVVVQDRSNALTVLGAQLYIAGRIAFWFMYVFGVFLVRSIFWNVATAGIFILLYALAFPG